MHSGLNHKQLETLAKWDSWTKKWHYFRHKVDERDYLLCYALSSKSLGMVTQVVPSLLVPFLEREGMEQMPISYKVMSLEQIKLMQLPGETQVIPANK